MAEAQATATGTLAATPLSQLLVYVLDKQLDGTFVFQTSDGSRSALWVEQGTPRKAKTATPVIYLGRLLLDLNAIGQEAYNRTLARVATDKRLHGQLLLECGALDEASLEVALGEQLLRQIEWMFTLPAQSAYGFYRDRNFLERYGGEGADIEPLNAIWRGIRNSESMERVEATLARLGSLPIGLHYAAQIARFGFTGPDRAIVDVIRARPHALDELIETGLAEPDRVKRVAFALMITRHLDIGAEPVGIHGVLRAPSDTDNTARRFQRNVERLARGVTPTVRGRPASAPQPTVRPISATPGAAPPISSPSLPAPLSRPRVSSPPISSPSASVPPISSPTASGRPITSSTPPADTAQLAALRADIQALKDKIPNQNYYEILGVPQDAPTTVISSAFFQLAKRYHPDRLGRESAAIREDAMKIFARMTEAHQVLADQQRRLDYDQVLQDGGGTAEEQEQVNRVMRAVIAHQKALVLIKKQNYAEAEKFAQEAMEGDPDQPEYVALYVRIVGQKPERAESQSYEDLLDLMEEAVERDPENERVRFARGELYKRMGKMNEAVRDFRWCVNRNPRNLDAAREVRLHAIRQGEKPPEIGPRPRKSTNPPKEEKGGIRKFFKR